MDIDVTVQGIGNHYRHLGRVWASRLRDVVIQCPQCLKGGPLGLLVPVAQNASSAVDGIGKTKQYPLSKSRKTVIVIVGARRYLEDNSKEKQMPTQQNNELSHETVAAQMAPIEPGADV